MRGRIKGIRQHSESWEIVLELAGIVIDSYCQKEIHAGYSLYRKHFRCQAKAFALDAVGQKKILTFGVNVIARSLNSAGPQGVFKDCHPKAFSHCS